jgi:hypothetical protein
MSNGKITRPRLASYRITYRRCPQAFGRRLPRGNLARQPSGGGTLQLMAHGTQGVVRTNRLSRYVLEYTLATTADDLFDHAQNRSAEAKPSPTRAIQSSTLLERP